MMPTTIVTNDNLSVVLTQVADRQDQLDAQLQALTDLIADQAVRTDEQDEQLRTQAVALRATTAQLAANIRQLNGNGATKDKSPKSNGKGSSGNPGNGNPGKGNPNIAGAKAGGRVSLGPIEGEAEVGGGVTAAPKEPPAPAKRKAHRWT
jgi:ABC-type transporter Mla subunit MlaD